MSTTPPENTCESLERVHLHALGALPTAEDAAVRTHLASCAECRRELEALRPALDALVAWPTDVLRPPVPLWERVASRIAAESGGEPLPPAPPARSAPEWRAVAPGIRCKLLATDPERRRVSMLVRLAPDTEYPPHRHAGVEELHLLDGVLIVDDKTLHPGDYLRSELGTADARVYSETGCTCVLITSMDDELR
jgi:anti-sigma factor ChrR (cupin superfamily)